MLAATAGLAFGTYLAAAIIGMAVELLVVGIILATLTYGTEFEVQSFIGWLVSQYTDLDKDINVIPVVDNILLRVFCFSLLIHPPFWGTYWLILPGALMLIKTCFRKN